ncbi:MAG: hypothetical protein KF781_09550 [Chitinophagaceae bacterium]|nr:hypothetical protein [Chitinophagaceae bacterium]MCW5905488.1 hypothetical protein [Chitinophagaceae bacterium]
MKDKGSIQSFPTSDSPVNEAFEGIVKIYYQIKGYITSTGKWFWKYETNKKQRGYQDIDLLAINNKQTVIVSVSTNLDDKINFQRNGKFNKQKYQKLKDFFDRVVGYLESTSDYKWLVQENRKIKKIIAIVSSPSKSHLKKISQILQSDNIEVIDMNKMVEEIIEYLDENENLKIQDQTLRLLQILNNQKLIKKATNFFP